MAKDINLEVIDQIGGRGDITRKIYEARLDMPDVGNACFNDGGGVNWNHGAVIARTGFGEIVGLISYDIIDYNKSIFIQTGWVEVEHRLQGIYRMLFEKVTEIAKEKKVLRITGSTAFTNYAMQATMDHLGRKPIAIVYDFEL